MIATTKMKKIPVLLHCLTHKIPQRGGSPEELGTTLAHFLGSPKAELVKEREGQDWQLGQKEDRGPGKAGVVEDEVQDEG